MPNKIVRDFIYVDVDRLYSLYSQINEGVADQIVQSYVDESSKKNFHATKESRSENTSIEAQVAEMSHRTENRLLHDHMYNLFEAELKDSILVPSAATPSNYRDILGQAFLIKVSGTAEIDDYDRIRSFLANFNSLTEAFAALAISGNEMVAAKKQLEELIKAMPNSAEKNRAKEELNKFKDAKSYAKGSGWSQDEALLKAIGQIIEFFYPDSLKITISPLRGNAGVQYCGMLDKRWLRIRPEFIRSLYGGNVEWSWTMVGQLTYLPLETPLSQADVDAWNAVSEAPANHLSLRSPIQEFFDRLRTFERAALENPQRAEVIVSPVAIYREMPAPNLPSSNQSQQNE